MGLATYTFALPIIVTAVVIYFPIIFIRKMDKMQQTMERIESNTRKP